MRWVIASALLFLEGCTRPVTTNQLITQLLYLWMIRSVVNIATKHNYPSAKPWQDKKQYHSDVAVDKSDQAMAQSDVEEALDEDIVRYD